MATAQEVRTLALSLPRTEEALVRDQVKFRVNRIVYVALSRDEESMGFAFPREERPALIASEPEKFFMPAASDERYNWVQVRLAALDEDEMTELVVSAWAMVVPKRLSADWLARLDVKAVERRGGGANDRL
ncbi:MmcQ/YjbR family DNA-binding protein [Streptomyces adustus]|uniref:MmcQ/YjbR family DNA-binding protein n=1 Tax=Streptomyces adustus TaxID=1609272 RepID=A0A5N8VHH0_9ACTN|nr:MmcQ/YjbR family DNA-binding protein [Streptomyces adustus]MPY34132.1 MmcQ/YjbR family DNA-binding protein [Streptomyces adustus]